MLYPTVRIWTVVLPFFFLPFKLPAWIWLAIYFALQFVYLGGSATAGGGGVAYMAHIGGLRRRRRCSSRPSSRAAAQPPPALPRRGPDVLRLFRRTRPSRAPRRRAG